jgi:hypothetical protein
MFIRAYLWLLLMLDMLSTFALYFVPQSGAQDSPLL